MIRIIITSIYTSTTRTSTTVIVIICMNLQTRRRLLCAPVKEVVDTGEDTAVANGELFMPWRQL